MSETTNPTPEAPPSTTPPTEPHPTPPAPKKVNDRDRVFVPAWLLKSISAFAANERMRFLLCCVQVSRVQESLRLKRPAVRIAATDGRGLCVVDLAIAEGDIAQIEEFTPQLVDRYDLAYFKGADLLEIANGERQVWSKCGGTKDDPTFERRLTLVGKHEGAFPNIQSVISATNPMDPIQEFYGNAAFLLRSAKVTADIMAKTGEAASVKWCGGSKKNEPLCTYATEYVTFRAPARNIVRRRLEIATYLMPVHNPD